LAATRQTHARGILLELCGGVALLAIGAYLLDLAGERLAPPQSSQLSTPPAQPPLAPATTLPERLPPLPPDAQNVASYTLRVRLDAVARTLQASGSIDWTNTSSRAVDELYFHLYLNAFKNERTRFLRSPFGAGRSGDRARDWGYVDVEKLVAPALGDTNLWEKAATHSPGDPHDQTDVRVPLPRPIAPGETLGLNLEFSAKLPAIVERTGHSDGFFFVAQWFPKLARLEPDGTWQNFSFHAQSEFYADYGTYDVTLDVPEAMKVGATGARVSQRVAGGRRILRHRAQRVHDFAWTAWDRFVERREKIHGVDVSLLHPVSHEANAEATLEALRFGLPHFAERYGSYPYPVLTVVHPPEHARNAGGMEYPTLITTGGPWWASHLGVRAVEAVTIHELGHQWFYGLLATNEYRFPFLDEGLTSYAESVALQAKYGAGSLLALPSFHISADAVRRAASAERGADAALGLPADRYPSFSALGALVYSRTATLLRTFSNVYGERAFGDVLSQYTARHRFRHPAPADFVNAVREVLGSDAARQLELALFERARVDYLVRELQSVPAREPAGVFDRSGGRETLEPSAGGKPSRWIGRVLVHRHGQLAFPVDVELVSADGSRQRRRWDGREAFISIEYDGPERLVGAVVDPDRTIVLDDDLLNNARSLEPEGAPRTLERTTYYAELLFGLLGP
jgi:hypothetical protein